MKGQDAPEGDFIVDIPGNPRPADVEVLWYSAQGRKLRLAFAPEPKGGQKTRGTVFVCPGRTEFIEKYFETARDLQAKGFAVAIFDWPGQGLSARLLSNARKGHVRDFSVFVEAFREGIEKIGRRAPGPHLILAHSMGGAIALEALRAGAVKARCAAFCSPMWGLSIPFYARWFARAARKLGFGGMSARKAPPTETFETNELTHDPQRWRLQRDLVAAEPRLDLGEPTLAWVVSALNVTRGFLAPGALESLAGLPVFVASGTEETIVKRSSHRAIQKRLKGAKLEKVEGARHEILMETDARRAEFWKGFDELCRRANV